MKMSKLYKYQRSHRMLEYHPKKERRIIICKWQWLIKEKQMLIIMQILTKLLCIKVQLKKVLNHFKEHNNYHLINTLKLFQVLLLESIQAWKKETKNCPHHLNLLHLQWKRRTLEQFPLPKKWISHYLQQIKTPANLS